MKLWKLFFICLVFIACNKDEEFVIVTPPEEKPAADYTVLEYLPAPGQFINDPSSGFTNIKSELEAVEYAQERLSNFKYVSLGSFGGYITVRMTERIKNGGGYDFKIAGNAIDTSNEPGIVWVMEDKNGNGVPDDEWYELKGSEYGEKGFVRDFVVTYFRPSNPNSEVKWKASDGSEGTIDWNGEFHQQEFYYPSWIKEDSYTLSGSMLPVRLVQKENGVWAFLPFEWGYVDNMGSDAAVEEVNGKRLLMNYFKISDAVDHEGNAVNLEFIDFIKVQSGVLGKSQVIGEVSTEVCGFFRI